MVSLPSASVGATSAYGHTPEGFHETCTIAEVPINKTASLDDLMASFARRRDVEHSSVIDIDGNIYPTLIIGAQEWMAENLRVTHDASGNEIMRHCYNNNPAYCDLYGGLYSWYTVMNGHESSNSNPSEVQGICPAGWHVPSHHEWTQLEQYICNELGYSYCEVMFLYDHETMGWKGTVEGNALKSCRQVGSPLEGECDTSEHPRWNAINTQYGFDEFGFSVHAGGLRWPDGRFNFIGVHGHYWTSAEHTQTSAWYRVISQHVSTIYRHHFNKTVGFSLRCVRNISEETTHNLDIHIQPEGAGIVTGAGEYTADTQVNITAVANDGWEFSFWTGDTDHIEDTLAGNVSVMMPDFDITLVAHFNKTGVSDHLLLSGEIIGDQTTNCFEALQTITVADFIIDAGGSVTLVAGESIHLLPGTKVKHGSYFLARIAAHDDDYCGIPRSVEIVNDHFIPVEEDVVSDGFSHEIRKNNFFKIYPNPTDGMFTLELANAEHGQTITVEVYGLVGGSLVSKELPVQRVHTLSLEGQQPGLYIIRILKGDQVGVERLIKK